MNLLHMERVVLISVLLAALPKYAIYLSPLRSLGAVGYFHPASIMMNLLAILFIVSPLMAAYLHFRRRPSRFFWLAAFVVPAMTFGVVPVPFAETLYTDNVERNTIAIWVVNLIYFLVVAYLYLIQRKSNSDVNANEKTIDRQIS